MGALSLVNRTDAVEGGQSRRGRRTAVPEQEATFPLLAVKDVVLFPRTTVILLLARERSTRAVDAALAGAGLIVVAGVRAEEIEAPELDDLFPIGCLAAITSATQQEGGVLQVVAEGIVRVRLGDLRDERAIPTIAVEELSDFVVAGAEARALVHHTQTLAVRHAEVCGRPGSDLLKEAMRADEPGLLADLLATGAISEVPERQALLEQVDPVQRLEQVAIHLSGALEVADLENQIKARVREQIDRNQREYYLREQLKAIHEELGGEGGNEIEALKSRVNERGMPAVVAEKLHKEIARLERMPAASAEATVIRTYVDTLIGLPWQERSDERLDVAEAAAMLDADHAGLEQVKDRLLDFLAVRQLTGESGEHAAQILCLVGPPGVGKTSLGRSIATAMGREFVRVSLGGVRDEADIRGHRRTYIGAMPGRIVSAIKQAGTLNPVILLDEIDKVASDNRGDPAAALLEVLDPEQNRTFTDHFLDVPYDLSQVLFLATANSLAPLPRPLLDRMEIIELSGYTEAEKVEIGRRYLLPKQLAAHGLDPHGLVVSDAIWSRIVREYTREAGVRGLEREIATICRKLARATVSGRGPGDAVTADGTPVLSDERLERYLGASRFGFERTLGESQVGVAIGLGTTEVGGELIPVEVATMPGRGHLTITGRAGDVMQESARAALSYARARAEVLQIPPDFQEKLDLHIHLPEGATPKDGPSAGITMATAVISALTRTAVRADTAMTGEITLRGRVLAIGGLKDKTLAAHRHGIRRLIAPEDNRRDLAKIPASVAADMTFFFVSSMEEVIQAALVQPEGAADAAVAAIHRVDTVPVTELPEIAPAIAAEG